MENAAVESTNTIQSTNATQRQQKDTAINITIILPTQAYFISGIRDFTLNLIKNMTDFSEQWAYRFQSIVDELCNNAIEHGSREGDDVKIIFRASPHQFIQITVEDNGTGQNRMSAAQLQELVTSRKAQNVLNGLIRGRGLPKIVSEWTDELTFSDNDHGGLNVRVKKYLNDPSLNNTSPGPNNDPSHIILS